MKGIPLKQLRSEQRAKRRQAAAGLALGGKKPVPAIPIASRPKRARQLKPRVPLRSKSIWASSF
jgi:hypothetical protein